MPYSRGLRSALLPRIILGRFLIDVRFNDQREPCVVPLAIRLAYFVDRTVRDTFVLCVNCHLVRFLPAVGIGRARAFGDRFRAALVLGSFRRFVFEGEDTFRFLCYKRIRVHALPRFVGRDDCVAVGVTSFLCRHLHREWWGFNVARRVGILSVVPEIEDVHEVGVLVGVCNEREDNDSTVCVNVQV